MHGNWTSWIVLSSTPIVRQFYMQKLKYEGKTVFFQNYFHLCLMIAHGKCAEIIYSVLVIQLIGKIWWFMLAQSLPPFVQYLVFVLHMISDDTPFLCINSLTRLCTHVRRILGINRFLYGDLCIFHKWFLKLISNKIG